MLLLPLQCQNIVYLPCLIPGGSLPILFSWCPTQGTFWPSFYLLITDLLITLTLTLTLTRCSKSGRESWAAGAAKRALPVKSTPVELMWMNFTSSCHPRPTTSYVPRPIPSYYPIIHPTMFIHPTPSYFILNWIGVVHWIDSV